MKHFKHIKAFANHLNPSLPLGPNMDTPAKVCKETIKDAKDWIKKNKKLFSDYNINAHVETTNTTYFFTVIVSYNLKTKKKIE